jgi:antitoxin component of MazEF toxin-antitoxin module
MQVAKMGNSLAIRLRGRRLFNCMNFDAVISTTDRDDRN